MSSQFIRSINQLLFFVATVFIVNSLNAQSKSKTEVKSKSIPVYYHGLTESLIDYTEPKGTINETTKSPKIGYHPKNDWILNESVNQNALPQGEDLALQKHYSPANTSKALTQSWDGISNFNVNPADPAVDVGPNHVVHMTNGPSGAYIQVYSKTGATIGSQIYFDNFMGMPGGLGDPIVLYDQRADRWMLSEFSNSGNNMHVAISQTGNPTGAYHTFSFNAPSFPDYPKYSIWNDSYIITTNESGNSPIYAINRADLLSGTTTSAQRFTVPSYNTIGFQATTPVSLLGTTPPPAGTSPMVMRMRDDAWSGVTNDALEIWDINIDWTNVSNSSVTVNTTLNMTLPFDSELCGFTSFSCIDQPGSNTNLDPLRELLMNRIMYRNFGSHESIVCCHVTDVSGNDQAGIRWYELRRIGGTAGAWTLYQESTYSPDTDSRWMPSIGISASGNIGLAYNVSSSSTYPSLRYTGRKECDPLNQMTEPETSIATGTTYNNSNRYGDYNSMGVDPSDGETFYFAGVYNPTTSGTARIGAFSIDLCNQNAEVQFDIAIETINEAEATTAASTCLDYHVIDVPISIGVSPTQNADITLFVTGGTATLGQDFILNNTTFTLAGPTLTGTAEIWVYNDAVVEGTENIILGYTLNANGGNAVSAIANQIVEIIINDNDLAPTVLSTTSTLLTQNFESGFGTFTTINPSLNTPFQVGNPINSSYLTFPATNTSNFAWINDDDCNCNQNNVDLIFPSIDLTGVTSGTLSFLSYFEGKTYQNNTETAEIYVSINNGAPSLVQAITTNIAWTTQTVDLTPYVNNSNVIFSIKYSDGTGWSYGIGIDNISIIGQTPIGVQTGINSNAGMTANVGPNTTVHFYDPASENIMMSLENTSTFDYGCVTVEVDRNGISALPFNTANSPDFLHSKTFKVSPTNTSPTGTYNVTLYYQENEVAGWESATGNSRNNAEVINVGGTSTINDVNALNANNYTISNSNSVVGSFHGDITFTGSFNTEISGLGVGIYNPNGSNLPTTQLQAADCGSTVTGLTALIKADLITGTSNYRFRLINGADTIIIDRAFRSLPLGLIPITYGKIYNVDVAVTPAGGVQGNYGAICTITTPIPTTQLGTAYCGMTTTSLTRQIKAQLVSGAANYRFRFIEGTDTAIVENPFRAINLNHNGLTLEFNKTYNVDIAITLNGIEGNYGQSCQLITQFPTTQLGATHCNIITESLTRTVKAVGVSGATGYRFRFIEGTDTAIVDRTFRSIQLNHAGLNLSYGKTYTVDVAVKVGALIGNYGANCKVKTIFPTSQLGPAYCGMTTYNINRQIKGTAVPGADNYRFRFIEGIDTLLIDRPFRALPLSLVALDYNKTYSVDIAVTPNAGVQGDYGPTCLFTTAFPNTQLASLYCNTTANSMSNKIFALEAPGASNYRFRMINGTDTLIFDRPFRNFFLDQVVGINTGTTYNVDIQVTANGITGDYGSVCTLTTPTTSAISTTNKQEHACQQTAVVFDAKLSPNPFNDAITLHITSEDAKSIVLVSIYDATGRLIEHQFVDLYQETEIKIGTDYNPGFYQVITTQNGNKKTARIIKQ
ncbi:MAG: T9SS type A sorting domain-containing protein [Crocinitomicaceae bacterium]|nr:T9SS type A sorting domain-containing protein [Crocinitomicaceae bacterium]